MMSKHTVMKKLIPFSFMLLCAVFAHAQKSKSQSDKRFSGLDTALEKLLKDWNAVGFAVAVVEKNKIVYSKGFGYRDYEDRKPVTPNTLFAIGSCTKAFTSSLLGMLEKDGKLQVVVPYSRTRKVAVMSIRTEADLQALKTRAEGQ